VDGIVEELADEYARPPETGLRAGVAFEVQPPVQIGRDVPGIRLPEEDLEVRLVPQREGTDAHVECAVGLLGEVVDHALDEGPELRRVRVVGGEVGGVGVDGVRAGVSRTRLNHGVDQSACVMRAPARS
jgi:hypothetical protein